MCTVVKRTLSECVSACQASQSVSSAALLAMYAPKRGTRVCTPTDETLITWPKLALAHAGQQRSISRTGAK